MVKWEDRYKLGNTFCNNFSCEGVFNYLIWGDGKDFFLEIIESDRKYHDIFGQIITRVSPLSLEETGILYFSTSQNGYRPHKTYLDKVKSRGYSHIEHFIPLILDKKNEGLEDRLSEERLAS